MHVGDGALGYFSVRVSALFRFVLTVLLTSADDARPRPRSCTVEFVQAVLRLSDNQAFLRSIVHGTVTLVCRVVIRIFYGRMLTRHYICARIDYTLLIATN